MTVVRLTTDRRMEMCDRCDSVKLVAKPCPKCGKKPRDKSRR